MNEKKPIYKQIWFWLIIGCLFVINIAFSFVYPKDYSNVFTSISGWVSGIATAVLGIIAVVQNERYEKDNQIYLEEQRKIQQQIVEENKKQNAFTIRMSYYNEISEYYCSIRDDLQSLLSKNLTLDLKKTVLDYCELSYDNPSIKKSEFIMSFDNQRMKILMIIHKVQLSHYSVKHRNGLVKSLLKISDLYYEYIEKYKDFGVDEGFTEKKLKEDIDKFRDAEMKLRDEAIYYLQNLQSVINYLSDFSNDADSCDILIQRLLIKKKKDMSELTEYLNNDMEDNDGQVENGN